jgi:hypothetical protein
LDDWTIGRWWIGRIGGPIICSELLAGQCRSAASPALRQRARKQVLS